MSSLEKTTKSPIALLSSKKVMRRESLARVFWGDYEKECIPCLLLYCISTSWSYYVLGTFESYLSIRSRLLPNKFEKPHSRKRSVIPSQLTVLITTARPYEVQRSRLTWPCKDVYRKSDELAAKKHPCFRSVNLSQETWREYFKEVREDFFSLPNSLNTNGKRWLIVDRRHTPQKLISYGTCDRFKMFHSPCLRLPVSCTVFIGWQQFKLGGPSFILLPTLCGMQRVRKLKRAVEHEKQLTELGSNLITYLELVRFSVCFRTPLN